MMHKYSSNKLGKQLISKKSVKSTDQQSSFQGDSISKQKHKTQLCKTFSLLGQCPYGPRCLFAHGKVQLISENKTLKKQKKCNGFWKKGQCSYGIRCQFIHQQLSWQTTAYLYAIRKQHEFENSYNSKLLPLLK